MILSKQEIHDIFNQVHNLKHKAILFTVYGAGLRVSEDITVNIDLTSALGGHLDKCEECGHIKVSYNSCRNRHCPKCQGIEREQWVLKQQDNMLNEKYFHLVFTVPDKLNPVALRNQRLFNSLLFKAASETLQQLAHDKKYLSAQIGITAVLHTWRQTLSFHALRKSAISVL